MATDNTGYFDVHIDDIIDKVMAFNPSNYASSRNYTNGDVSRLSPYISRGVISTKYVYETLIKRGFKPGGMFKFIQELAWRDYWQQVWIHKKNDINQDLKHQQEPIVGYGIPAALNERTTGILAIDAAITKLVSSGYIHNHLRMYMASLTCNIANHHWKEPARWMYYHLLDGDWASNALSWQWVAGANSNKKYYANQENINTYCNTSETGTYLDVPYDNFQEFDIPKELLASEYLNLVTPLPQSSINKINTHLPTLIYNSYNLDPFWRNDIEANRILLLEPSHFNQYPVSEHVINFILGLSNNILNIQLFVGEFNELKANYNLKTVYFKEHPLNEHYQGTCDQRDWMFNVEGYYPSFFAFWKKCKKQIIF